MEEILTNASVGITELKKNPGHLIESAHDSVVILKNNKPAAYLVPVKKYQAMMNILEDIELSKIAHTRLQDNEEVIAIELDDL